MWPYLSLLGPLSIQQYFAENIAQHEIPAHSSNKYDFQSQYSCLKTKHVLYKKRKSIDHSLGRLGMQTSSFITHHHS